MLNTRELEKRWLHYKIKSYAPYAIITISLSVIVLIIVFFSTQAKQEIKALMNNKYQVEKTEKISQDNNRTTNIKEKNVSNFSPLQEIQAEKKLPSAQQTVVINSQQMTLTPSMNFMKHIQSEEQQPIYQTIHSVPVKHKKSKPIKRKKVIQQQNVIKEEYIDIMHTQTKNTKHVKIEPKHIITIERKDSQQDIKEIIRRFKQNNNPALSLFVAKKYYELGNYEQAYNYALITNGINNDIEESWIIFAKSLVKLHKRDMALKTLTEYIKYSHSGNAKILFNDIRSGKFK